MKNLFLSPKGTSDLQKIFQYIDMLLNEQRNQRSDLAQIKRTLDYIIKIMNHQDTIDYFSKKYGEDLEKVDDSTSHQTDLEEHE